MFNKLKTRKGRLEEKIKTELNNKSPEIKNILDAIDSYESDNINTITKLKRGKRIDMKKINGALKQTINAHGPISKELIGSASKRIYGILMINTNVKENNKYVLSIRNIFLGFIIGVMFILGLQII